MPEQAAATATTPTPDTGITGTTQAPATTEAPLDITKYINNDGTFKEGYKDVLAPEELRTNKVYDIFSDIKGLMKCVGNQAITLGKYGSTKGVLPINEKSTPFEVEAFRQALGVPKDGSGYKYTPPEDISSEDLSPEFMTETFTALNKSNLNQSQVDTVMNLYANHLRTVEKAVDEELARQVSDATNRLQAKWGDQFEARTNLAKAFITKMTSRMSAEEYEELFGKEVQIQNADGITTTDREGGINIAEFAPLRPLLLDLFANIEERYGVEDSALAPEVAGVRVGSLQQQIDDANQAVFDNVKLSESLNPRDREKYADLIRVRDLLMKRLYPT